MFASNDRLLPVNAATAAGAASYSRLVLAIYDTLVMRISNRFIYGCPTHYTRSLYDAHISANHLDIGVGTGYYLQHTKFPAETPHIALMDLNRNCLDVAARRLHRYRPTLYQQNILDLRDMDGVKFDSVALNYLLHCLPGDSLLDKEAAFRNTATLLNPGGVMFGTTIIGAGVDHKPLETRLIARYNAMGVFSNRGDTPDHLRTVLERHFTDVTLEIRGRAVAFFTGRI